MLTKFNPKGVAASPFYSHGVEAKSPQRLLFISGQVGQGPDGALAEGIGDQTRAAIGNLKAVLAGADMEIGDIAKMTIYLTDESSFEGFAAAGAPLLSNPPPAITLLYVKALASPATLIEIEAIAAR